MSLLDDEPRIVIVSQRSYYTPVFRTSAYEFEDVICAVDHADLLLPTFEHPRSHNGFWGKSPNTGTSVFSLNGGGQIHRGLRGTMMFYL